MALVLDEEQTMLAQTAGAFMRESSPISRFRALRDSSEERGYSLDVYKQMAELGWTAIPFSEADGGMGMGLAGLVIVTEAMGRGLAPEPLIPSIAMAGQALSLAGSADQKSTWLAPAIEGEKVLALAYAERGQRYDLRDIALGATDKDGGYELSGEKTLVLGGQCADAFVVAARTAGKGGDADGITLLLVPADAAGVSTERQQRADCQNSAILKLEGVKLGADAVIGKAGEGHGVLCDVVDRATVALCGEMLGGMNEAFDRTLDYLKERKQFDTVIGTFQALKHRAARMYIELELARSVVMAAARAIDDGADNAKVLVSIAKAKLSDAYALITNEAVQMHGGIGMTDEHDIGFFMKRARGCEMTFGDAAYHRDRFASLSGY
ncbi:MAG: acyl-CoA dehydrogenase family protein [Myxococcales bacterium]|nr:acyl-CoA dehydrogenase family protein [Myxococcales bacterium]